MTSAIRRIPPLSLFLTAAVCVYAVELVAVRTSAFAARSGVVGPAVAFDLAVFVPALYWLLVMRRGSGSWFGFFGVLTAAWLLAPVVLPPAQRHYLAPLFVLGPVAEVVSLGYAAGRLRRVVRVYRGWRGDPSDLLARLRHTCASGLGEQAIWRALADELAMWRYAVAPPPPAAPGATAAPSAPAAPDEQAVGPAAFSYHRRSAWAAIVLAIGLVGTVETAGVHLLVAIWSVRAAWLLTFSSAYAVVWLVADLRACARRPILLLEDRLLVRVGLRWTVQVPYAAVADAAVVPSGTAPARRTPGYLRATPFGQPALLLELSEAVHAEGPYGIGRDVRRIGVSPDDASGFMIALAARRAS